MKCDAAALLDAVCAQAGTAWRACVESVLVHPTVQRMRHMRCTGFGFVYFPRLRRVTRFRHSVRVAHLACIAAAALTKNPQEVACVTLAALLHDVGHGPFSHAYDDAGLNRGIAHELRSVRYARHILRDCACGAELPPLDSVLHMVEHFILPTTRQSPTLSVPSLAQIVNNVPRLLDVDKLEYLESDARAVGMTQFADALADAVPCMLAQGRDVRGMWTLPAWSAALQSACFLMRDTLHRYVYRRTDALDAIFADLARWHTTDGAEWEMLTDDDVLALPCAAPLRHAIDTRVRTRPLCTVRDKHHPLRVLNHSAFRHPARGPHIQEDVSLHVRALRNI